MAHKAAVTNDVKIVNEIIFHLKNQYLPHNGEQGTFIEDIPCQEERFLLKQ